MANFADMRGWQRIGIRFVWPYNYKILFEPFEPYGARPGDVLIQTDLAHSLRLMVEAEELEWRRSSDRVRALEAARAYRNRKTGAVRYGF